MFVFPHEFFVIHILSASWSVRVRLIIFRSQFVIHMKSSKYELSSLIPLHRRSEDGGWCLATEIYHQNNTWITHYSFLESLCNEGVGTSSKTNFPFFNLSYFFSPQFGAKCYLNFFRTFLSLFMSLAGLWPPQLLVVSSWNIYRREQSWCTHPLQCPNYSYTPLIIPLLQ